MAAATTVSTTPEIHIPMGTPAIVTTDSTALNVHIQMGMSAAVTTNSIIPEVHIQMGTPIAVTTNSTTPQVHNQMSRQPSSAHFNRPLLHLLQDTKEGRKNYMEKGVPLHKLALKGNWNDARPRIVTDMMSKTAITKGWQTALHVAAGANRVDFVEQLVDQMTREDLELQDYNQNTAFFLAAGVGNPRLTEIMIKKNNSLPKIKGKNGVTPLHFAVLQGRSEMARFLYNQTTTTQIFQERDWVILFLTSINAGMYDLALHMLDNQRNLALVRDDNGNTGLHLLARKQPMIFFTKQTQALQLVRLLWRTILTSVDSESEIHQIIRNPSPLILDAATVGNFGFLAELISIYPDLIWERDIENRTIIHIAVLYRHARIFNLIHEMGSIKDHIVDLMDDDKNNLLHLAARLAPLDQLNKVSGAAFQLMLELLWFQEVKKVMLPLDIEARNSKGITPSEYFTIEHEDLLQKAEDWMKGTAKSCMLVSTVIATGVFSVAFSLPGGNDNHGSPNYREKPIFQVFIISDATAFISSATSTLVFLSILFSRYAEYDFYKSLPLKLIFGLIALFISITSMMVAFSSALFITFYDGLKWIPGSVSVLAFLLILLFGILQISLWNDILYSTYYCRSLFRPNEAYALLEK